MILLTFLALGVAPAKTAMCIAYGDMWTNMIQPFWALPLLAIVGLTIRDIMGYCVITLLWSGLVITAGITKPIPVTSAPLQSGVPLHRGWP